MITHDGELMDTMKRNSDPKMDKPANVSANETSTFGFLGYVIGRTSSIALPVSLHSVALQTEKIKGNTKKDLNMVKYL